MTFILRMAAREIRASWKRLLFFFVCIAVGVASIVAIRSVIQSVRGALAREARFLLAADMRVQSNNPLAPAVRQRLETRWGTGARMEIVTAPRNGFLVRLTVPAVTTPVLRARTGEIRAPNAAAARP